jgi:protein-tyrosine phosphatase
VIDLHCHILPGIDDGAADVDDSLAMARVAADDGIEAVCATPHIRHDHDVRVKGLAQRVAQLNVQLERASVPLKVLGGGELAATSVAGIDDDGLEAISVGGGNRWLLLEPAPGPLDDSLERAAAELSRRGYRSLIAHPERHLAIDMRERLAKLVEAGALVQVTAATLLDPRTRDAMLELAACGLVHVLGSDSHSSRHGREPRLAAALGVLHAELLSQDIDWIAERAPAAIIRGEDIAPPFPAAL